jgi:fumarylpyruvate hydrolase
MREAHEEASEETRMSKKFAVDKPKRPSVKIEGNPLRFPVRRIFCVGQNYADHVKEMGGDASKPAPFFFCKPADAISANTVAVPYPTQTSNLHHEVELVIAIGTGGGDIKREEALGHVYGYAVGVDLTRRDLQAAAKEKGRPWDTAKGFDHSAPISAIVPWKGELAKTKKISLTVNGAKKQEARLEEMIWPAPDIIAFLSQSFELKPGDLIFTGTPAGVGPLVRGDQVVATIEGLPMLTFAIS